MTLTKKQIKSLIVKGDPTAQNCYGICYKLEYEPGEFALVWLAREMDMEIADKIVEMFKETIK